MRNERLKPASCAGLLTVRGSGGPEPNRPLAHRLPVHR